ncbi:sialate O-acetylesterase [Termitidicoccus mucosus]|uniref:Sialate O-acetylesterase domain-containing protein n=1 Tax=Termitidicoccus mucosus TaxID=1184151 RepID=A0A178IQE6_9BACT|nr:hypothetical protein AW736_02330 [Opitutaceae bacterium TSB47]
MKILLSLAAFWMSVSLLAIANGGIVPAPLFTDHAVLQREKLVPVWGTASVRERITVSFAGHVVATTADADGRWRVDLPALEASAEPRDLVIAGATERLSLHDILVGEVWLASGQSNMEWWLKWTFDADLEIRASGNFPLIREFKVDHTVADTPATTVRGQWKPNGPDTSGNFSAVAYYFARDLALHLRVPVGIVCSAWGGTELECWTPESAILSSKYSKTIKARWESTIVKFPDYGAAIAKYEKDLALWRTARDAALATRKDFSDPKPIEPVGPGHRLTPSGLYNGMIAPLIPYAWRGVIWYQGESNAGRGDEYKELFPLMISAWRNSFGQDNIPFFWIQIPSFGGGDSNGTVWASLREAQAHALSLPATGQAVTLDIGSVTDVHPRNKLPVGRRLVRLALHRAYGFDVLDRGPVVASTVREGDSYQVRFDNVSKGLQTPYADLGGFELAGADRVFHPAKAKIEGTGTVILSSSKVSDPVAVRYAWRNAPNAGLFNMDGLPAEPFRTDDW